MRIYSDCEELVSEIMRDVWEMGQEIAPKSMQNKIVEGNPDFITKEIINYSYCLTDLVKPQFLFKSDKTAEAWANAEFLERIGKVPVNPGEAWKIRAHVWEQFLVNGKFDYAYSVRMHRALDIVKEELVRNPYSRQLIISIWDRKDIEWIGGLRRVPCSIYYQLLFREDKLHIVYNQRSCDVSTFFGTDIYMAWSLKEHIAEAVGMKGGYLYHNIGSLHCYQKDWAFLKSFQNY